MPGVTQLGYLGISVKDLDSWQGYATRLLGLEEVTRDSEGTLFLGMDSRHSRFHFRGDGRDDVAYAGWEVASGADLATLASALEAAGVPVEQGSRELAERRHVTDLVIAADPDGNRIELFHGHEPASHPREARFRAEELGLGHFVLFVADLERTMDFYTRLLGFRVSDYVNAMGRMGFLHCNPRHHSVAFGEYPEAKRRIHHFMLQTNEIDPVGRAYDEVSAGAARLVTTLGRHSNDEMVSFYMRNPSGFAVEYGWGAREIDDCAWTVREYESGSLWGHRPVRETVPAAPA